MVGFVVGLFGMGFICVHMGLVGCKVFGFRVLGNLCFGCARLVGSKWLPSCCSLYLDPKVKR